MEIFLDLEDQINDNALDLPLSTFLERMVGYMQKVDSYKAKLDIDSDSYLFTITAQSKDSLKKE